MIFLKSVSSQRAKTIYFLTTMTQFLAQLLAHCKKKKKFSKHLWRIYVYHHLYLENTLKDGYSLTVNLSLQNRKSICFLGLGPIFILGPAQGDLAVRASAHKVAAPTWILVLNFKASAKFSSFVLVGDLAECWHL